MTMIINDYNDDMMTIKVIINYCYNDDDDYIIAITIIIEIKDYNFTANNKIRYSLKEKEKLKTL